VNQNGHVKQDEHVEFEEDHYAEEADGFADMNQDLDGEYMEDEDYVEEEEEDAKQIQYEADFMDEEQLQEGESPRGRGQRSGHRTTDGTNANAIPDSPSNINKYDLWGIHDMLLAGYAAPACYTFRVPGSKLMDPSLRDDAANLGNMDTWEGNFSVNPERDDCKKKVQAQVVVFARLLAHLHPIKGCREAIQAHIENGRLAGRRFVDAVAETSWNCLSRHFACPRDDYFCRVQDTIAPGKTNHQPGRQFRHLHKLRAYALRDASFPPNDGVTRALGACRKVELHDNTQQFGTKWGRACSYWSSIHVLALRADALAATWKTDAGADLKFEMLTSLATILAGGALLCWS
jgi:hypothetical protein